MLSSLQRRAIPGKRGKSDYAFIKHSGDVLIGQEVQLLLLLPLLILLLLLPTYGHVALTPSPFAFTMPL